MKPLFEASFQSCWSVPSSDLDLVRRQVLHHLPGILLASYQVFKQCFSDPSIDLAAPSVSPARFPFLFGFYPCCVLYSREPLSLLLLVLSVFKTAGEIGGGRGKLTCRLSLKTPFPSLTERSLHVLRFFLQHNSRCVDYLFVRDLDFLHEAPVFRY